MQKHKRIEIPKFIKVMWRNVSIVKDDPSFMKDNVDCYGSYDKRVEKLNLQPELKNEILANTLLHEIIHISISDMSLNQELKTMNLLSDDQEEMITNSVANHLTTIFKDNDWLLPFLQQEIKGDNK
tara:strand:+ start:755 stop:1132 length:378 start_codon:yes stop_codon:yes gene_type:complete